MGVLTLAQRLEPNTAFMHFHPCFRESNLWKKKKAKEKDLVKTFLEFHKDFGKVL